MPTPAAKMMAKFKTQLVVDTKQVFTGKWKQPQGLTRGVVELDGCEQTVIAAGHGHRKDGPVLAVGTGGVFGVLEGPPGKAGPTGAATLKIAGQPFSSALVAYLVYMIDTPGEFYEAYDAGGQFLGPIGSVGIFPEQIGASIFPEAADAMGPGTRIRLEAGNSGRGRLVTADFLGAGPGYTGGSTFEYDPPAGWTVSSPMKVGATIYWFEAELVNASTTMQLRLMESSSAKWGGAVSTTTEVAVPASVFSLPDWLGVRGPDFTNGEAGVWIEEFESSTSAWTRARVDLDGASSGFRGGPTQDFVDSVIEAGHPVSADTAVTRLAVNEESPPGDVEFQCVRWTGDEDDDYINPFGSMPVALDLAPDPAGDGIWTLRGNTVEQWTTTGALVQAVEIELVIALPFRRALGFHVVAVPFAFPSEGEG